MQRGGKSLTYREKVLAFGLKHPRQREPLNPDRLSKPEGFQFHQ